MGGMGLTDEVGADVEGAPVFVCCANVVQLFGGGTFFWSIVSEAMGQRKGKGRCAY